MPQREQQDPDGRELWTIVRLDDLDDRIEVQVRLEQDGLKIFPSGIKVTTSDQSELTPRELRIRAGEAFSIAKALRGIEDPRDTRSKPSRPGPAGHPPEHFRAVLTLWEQAQELAPGREIKWMRERWEPPVPDATMRRWRDRAVEMKQRGEL
jgi:hypothetical protein